MIKLNSTTFARAIEKAQSAPLACDLVDTDEVNFTFRVGSISPKRGPYTVDIWFQGGTTWTSCDCAAGIGLHRRDIPQPCYHVAAAALSIGLLPAAMPLGAALDPRPEGAISRQVPPQLIPLSELAPLPTPASMPAPTPALQSGQGCLRRCLQSAARALGRVFWFAREARA